MNEIQRPITRDEAIAVRKLQCDGVKRYAVKGIGRHLTYDEAYEAILLDTRSSTSGAARKPREITFRGNSMRRIRFLNERYLCALRITKRIAIDDGMRQVSLDLETPSGCCIEGSADVTRAILDEAEESDFAHHEVASTRCGPPAELAALLSAA
jgi:hypothetical protein